MRNVRTTHLISSIRKEFPLMPYYEARRCAKQIAWNKDPANALKPPGGALERQVVAYIRHNRTDYEMLLQRGIPQKNCRRLVRDEVAQVLNRWKGVKKTLDKTFLVPVD